MIVVRVELHSAITGRQTEIARMQIANRGDGTHQRGNYIVRVLRGRGTAALDKGVVQRNGGVVGHPRLAKHVWTLVLSALKSCGYQGAES